VGLRYCNVYGPGEARKGKRASMIYQLAQQIKQGPPRLFGDGKQKRDYIYIDDVVRANLLAMELNESQVINIATGTATSFNNLVSLLRMTVPIEGDTGRRQTMTFLRSENARAGVSRAKRDEHKP